MDNTVLIILTAGVISTCFLIDKDRVKKNQDVEIELKNDTINILNKKLDSHVLFINDIVSMADSHFYREVELIHKHFAREININKK
jgi:hypothetical protein